MIVWGLELKDSVSVPANAAAAAMGTAAEQARVLQRAMQSAQSQVTKMAALGDAAGVRKAAANYHVLEESLHALPPEFQHVSEASEAAEGVFGDVFGAELLLSALERIGDFAIEAGKKMLEMALESREHFDDMAASLGALAGEGEEAGRSIMAMLRDLEKEIPQSEAQVTSWARTLEAAGVTDMGALRDQLKAIAGADALVEGGGERLLNVLAKLNEASIKGTKIKFSVAQLAGTGLTEEDVMKQLGMTPKQLDLAKKQGTLTGTEIAEAMTRAMAAKSGGVVAQRMGDLSTLATRGKEMFQRLFEGIDPGPLTEGLKEMFSVFDTAQPSGTVLKDTITGAFNAIFRVAGRVFAWLKDAFLHLMIWGLEAAIALKPIVRGLMEWGAAHDVVGILLTALKGVGIVLGLIAAVTAVVVVVGGTMASIMSAAGVAVAGFVFFLIGLLPRAWEALDAFAHKAADAAANFIQGFADGIRNGIGIVVEAVKNMGTAAWNALKGALGIHSPSTLMMTAGMQTSEGFAQGIDRGEGRVEQASIGMSHAAYAPARDASAGSSDAAGPSSPGAGRSVVFNFGGITVHIDSSHAVSAQEHRQIVEEEFGSLAERLALMIGSAPEPA